MWLADTSMEAALSNLHKGWWAASPCKADAGTSEPICLGGAGGGVEPTTGVSTKPATTDGSAPSVPDTTTITSAALTAAPMHPLLHYTPLCCATAYNARVYARLKLAATSMMVCVRACAELLHAYSLDLQNLQVSKAVWTRITSMQGVVAMSMCGHTVCSLTLKEGLQSS